MDFWSSLGESVTTKAGKKSSSVFEKLAAEILRASAHSAPLPAVFDRFSEEIRSLEHEDYGQRLRRLFARTEVREIVAEARSTVWPHLNDEPVRLVSPGEFTRLWSGLGVQFRTAKLNGAEGLAILGFYVRKMGRSRLPLICVNTAHHPAAIGAAFSHEMGHHLMGQLFGSHKEHAQLMAYATYREHLDDPEELAADILVSLGVLPKATARKIFMKPERQSLPNSVSRAVLEYMENRYGLRFDERGAKKPSYIAGLIHFVKLRRALLAEYDI
jgi:hypothetical protein